MQNEKYSLLRGLALPAFLALSLHRQPLTTVLLYMKLRWERRDEKIILPYYPTFVNL